MTISAKVIADSVGADAPRLTTLQCRYPKFIHGEVMTHRVFSRNASSSRAIPVERLIRDVIDDPVYPSFWGKNQPGMSAAEECDARIELNPEENWSQDDYSREQAWDVARDHAIDLAQRFADAGFHKQIVNRLLEPFCHINVVVTATEWSNFFALRCHPAAQPEMRELAERMRDAMAASTPQMLAPDKWHLPYVDYHGDGATLSAYIDRTPYKELTTRGMFSVDENALKTGRVQLSVARCARVSYLTQDGKTPYVVDDLKLYDRLVGSVPLHASPAEHQGTPDDWLPDSMFAPDPRECGRWQRPELHGNLVGWCQYRKQLEQETAQCAKTTTV